MAQWFFLKRRWIGAGCMISGTITAAYAFFNVIRYARYREVPPLRGMVPMAFDTAILLVIIGIAVFWIGYAIFYAVLTPQKLNRQQLSRHEMIQLALAMISALAVIAVALIGALK